MKHLKILGLAAVAALALMAVFGAGAASASAVLCATEADGGTIANATCTRGGTKQLPNPSTIEWTLRSGTVAEITSTFDNWKCTESKISGTVTNGATGTGSIEAVTFSGCTDSFGGTCTMDTSASATNKWPFTVTANVPHDGNGGLHLSNITLKWGCPIGTCRYTASTATPTVTGGETATILTSKVALSREEVSSFGCSATATWSGAYRVTKPDSFWAY
jgi:hypothetical protein